MADPNERFYWGDFRLADHGVDHFPAADRAPLQEFSGVDRKRRLVISNSSNFAAAETVRAVLTSGDGVAPSRKAFRAREAAMIDALVARSLRQDPLVWVEDSTLSKAVGGYAAPTVTCVAHGRSTGDVVLIRRLGAGLYSLATVTKVDADTFTVVAVTGGQLHAIAAADEIHLVESYWIGMAPATLPKVSPKDDDHWGMCEWLFRGSGAFRYARTSASVGS